QDMRAAHRLIAAAVAVTTIGAAGGCGSATPRPQTAGPSPQLVQPGAPGTATREIGVAQATDLSKVPFNDADARFMTGMLGHHAQAVDMVALIAERTSNDMMRMLGKRIDMSQADEMDLMRTWLTDRGLPLPDPHAHHMHGATLMPGMLSEEEMAA